MEADSILKELSCGVIRRVDQQEESSWRRSSHQDSQSSGLVRRQKSRRSWGAEEDSRKRRVAASLVCHTDKLPHYHTATLCGSLVCHTTTLPHCVAPVQIYIGACGSLADRGWHNAVPPPATGTSVSPPPGTSVSAII